MLQKKEAGEKIHLDILNIRWPQLVCWTVLDSAGVAAVKAVVPADRQICAVGGVSHNDFADYMAASI